MLHFSNMYVHIMLYVLYVTHCSGHACPRASDLCSVGDQLLVKLCTTLEGSKVRVPYIKDALQQALPSLSGASLRMCYIT